MDEYVLPKFKVEIDTPGTVMPEDGKVRVLVRANYTYGMPMKGTVVIEAHKLHRYKRDLPLVKKTVTINGEKMIEFDIKDELKFCHNKSQMNCYVRAKVTENLTGLSQECEANIEIDSTYEICTSPDDVKFERGSTANMIVCR